MKTPPARKQEVMREATKQASVESKLLLPGNKKQ